MLLLCHTQDLLNFDDPLNLAAAEHYQQDRVSALFPAKEHFFNFVFFLDCFCKKSPKLRQSICIRSPMKTFIYFYLIFPFFFSHSHCQYKNCIRFFFVFLLHNHIILLIELEYNWEWFYVLKHSIVMLLMGNSSIKKSSKVHVQEYAGANSLSVKVQDKKGNIKNSTSILDRVFELFTDATAVCTELQSHTSTFAFVLDSDSSLEQLQENTATSIMSTGCTGGKRPLHIPGFATSDAVNCCCVYPEGHHHKSCEGCRKQASSNGDAATHSSRDVLPPPNHSVEKATSQYVIINCVYLLLMVVNQKIILRLLFNTPFDLFDPAISSCICDLVGARH